MYGDEYTGILPPQLAKLVVKVDGTADKAEEIIKDTMREIRGELSVLANELNLATSGTDREKAYAMIRQKMARLERRLTALQEADLEYAGHAANAQAQDDTGVKVAYSQRRADEISAIVSPMQGENLAAVFTEKMEKSVIQSLRTATVATMREAAVAGMPMKDMARVLNERWQATVKDGAELQFRDAAGKVWDTKTYMMMNTRTNAMRVYNDNLVDNIARATGSDLVMVSTGGDPHCRQCYPWEGRILSISGATKGFPTYEQARAAGLFHPNCVHTLEPVDELVDADEIEAQRGAAAPDEVEDPLRQAFQMDVDTKQREDGLSEEEAAVAVKREWLKDAIRNGMPFEGSEAVIDGLTDAEVNELVKGDSGRVPTFEPTKGTKKHPQPPSFTNGSAGGVIRLDRRRMTADALRELDGLKERLEQAEADERGKGFTPNTDGLDALLAAIDAGVKTVHGLFEGCKDTDKEIENIAEALIAECGDYSVLADIKARAIEMRDKENRWVINGCSLAILNLKDEAEALEKPTDEASQKKLDGEVTKMRKRLNDAVEDARKAKKDAEKLLADIKKLRDDSKRKIEDAKKTVEDEQTRQERARVAEYLRQKEESIAKIRAEVDGWIAEGRSTITSLEAAGIDHAKEKDAFNQEVTAFEQEYADSLKKLEDRKKELARSRTKEEIKAVLSNFFFPVRKIGVQIALKNLQRLIAKNEYETRERARKAQLPQRTQEDKNLLNSLSTKVENGFNAKNPQEVYAEAPHDILAKIESSVAHINESPKYNNGRYKEGAYCIGDTIYLHAGDDWHGTTGTYLHESGHACLNKNGDYVSYNFARTGIRDAVTQKYKPILTAAKSEVDALVEAIWGRDESRRGKPLKYYNANMVDLAKHLGVKYNYDILPIEQQDTIGALSDIMEGITKCKCKCGVGHGASYWRRGEASVLHEIVANITQVMCSDSDEAKAVRRALPQTVALVRSIVYN